mmetsp:Transcript_74744/g.91843  ORF Transcript_74744/g.91843 Transcript_74744/m.91843 type:complete len:117 (+) Transcript_74744:513-863(+)
MSLWKCKHCSFICNLNSFNKCVKCNKPKHSSNIQTNDYYFEPILPKIENICDNCGHQLSKRMDDEPSLFNKRMDIYKEKSDHVLNNFDGDIINFEIQRGIHDWIALKNIIQYFYDL